MLVEKPITSSSDQARQLIDEAEKRGLVLMVDHTFVYTGAVRKMRELIDAEGFGRVRYYDSTRVNLGLFQHDVNVLWDLAVHDLSIMSYIIDDKPVAVSATGHALAGQPEYVAYLTVFFGDIIAHINVNWLSPVKIRRTLIGGTNQMIVYDDLETSEKIKLYDKGITVDQTPEDVRKLLISYRTGDPGRRRWPRSAGGRGRISPPASAAAAADHRQRTGLETRPHPRGGQRLMRNNGSVEL